MQALEASLSLLVFASIAPLALSAIQEPAHEHPLYRLQLAEDAWRVLYLRGDFEDFGDGKRAQIERDLSLIGVETGMCCFLEGVRFTNCRGPEGMRVTASIRRTVISEGNPLAVTFSIGR